VDTQSGTGLQPKRAAHITPHGGSTDARVQEIFILQSLGFFQWIVLDQKIDGTKISMDLIHMPQFQEFEHLLEALFYTQVRRMDVLYCFFRLCLIQMTVPLVFLCLFCRDIRVGLMSFSCSCVFQYSCTGGFKADSRTVGVEIVRSWIDRSGHGSHIHSTVN
jgi:hypothetical protein